VVVTVGVLVSLFVSLTLTPMLCSRFLDVSQKHGPVYRFFDRLLDGLDAFYRRLLGWTLAHRGVVLAATLLVVLSSGFFFAQVGKDFIPGGGRRALHGQLPRTARHQPAPAMDAVLEEIDRPSAAIRR
jgi:multidrug efflux pump subunit AcrB